MLFGYAVVLGSIILFNFKNNKDELKSKLKKDKNTKYNHVNGQTKDFNFKDKKLNNLNKSSKNLNDARINKSIYENFNSNMSG